MYKNNLHGTTTKRYERELTYIACTRITHMVRRVAVVVFVW